MASSPTSCWTSWKLSHVAVVFITFALVLSLLGVHHGGFAWLLLWPASSFLVVATAYLGGGARLLGKRPGGSLHPFAILFHLPYLLFTWTVWQLVLLLRGSREASLVTEGLWLGRRPRLHDIPQGVALVADMTCEFPAARHITRDYEYLAFPTLDGHVPPLKALVAFARQLASHPGPVYLHCAQGHGRSALAAACVLIAKGLADSPQAAMQMIRAARPRVRLTRSQAALLRQAAEELKQIPKATDAPVG